MALNKKAIDFLKAYLKPFYFQGFLVLVSVIIISCSILALGNGLKYLVDKGFSTGSAHNINLAFIFLVLTVLILAVASFNRAFKVNWICEQIEANIKQDAFKAIIKVSPNYFNQNKVSDILSRLSSDLTLLTNSIITLASYSLRNAVMALGGLIMLAYTSIKLTFFVIGILPIVLIPIILIGRKIKALSLNNQKNIAICSAHLEETLTSLKIVQAYNREDYEYKKYLELINSSLRVASERVKFRAMLFSSVIALVLSSIAFVLWIGGKDVIAGTLSAGSLSSFVFFSVLVATSIGSISEFFGDWQRAMAALQRIMEIVDIKSDISEIAHPIALKETNNLRVNNVTFVYSGRSEMKVLNNLSFEVGAGQVVALVGPSGAGKTTVFNLLLRFIDPASGDIYIGKQNIKDLSLKDLRNQFALVSQDPIIFSGTAYENILYGRLDATAQEVIEAAKAAEIFDFFQSFPEGLHTYVGEKGMQLSGGQKQRIAIARAILKNPRILLLDEATSSLDNENEKLVQVALNRLRKNRTTLIIAHRISTIIDSDNIIVLDKGKILAQGSHEELLLKSAVYQKLNSLTVIQDADI